MKGNRISNTWYIFINFILDIATEFKLKIYTQLISEKRLTVGLVVASSMLKFP